MSTYYLLRQPDTLETLAIHKLASWIGGQAERWLSPVSELLRRDSAGVEAALARHILTIRNRFECNVPRMLHDALLSRTITELYRLGVETEAKIIARMIETLFTKYLTSLTLSFNQFKIFRDSLYCKSHLLIGVIHLDLNFDRAYYACRYADDMESDVIQLLQRLQGLKYLTIKIFSTDAVLRCVVNNCPLIEELNLDQISQYGICMLSRLRYLRNITISTSLPHKDFETLLLSCENIEHISTMPDSTYVLSKTLKQLAVSKHNSKKSLNLKTFKGNNNTLEELQMIFRLCPQIQNLTLDTTYLARQINIMAITGLKYLRELTLYGYAYHTVRGALQVVGGQLEHLRLEHITPLDLAALIDISQTCPNLESLAVENSTFIDRNLSCTKKLDVPPFRNLKKLCLDMTSSFYIQESPLDLTLLTCQKLKLLHEPAHFLLSNCLNVEYIELTRTIMLTEDFMVNILDKNPLTYLRELKIVQSNLMPRTMTELTAPGLRRLARGRAPAAGGAARPGLADADLQICSFHPPLIPSFRRAVLKVSNESWYLDGFYGIFLTFKSVPTITVQIG